MNFSNANFKEKGLMQGDLVLWMAFLSLCMVSIIEVYSSSTTLTYKSGAYYAPIVEHAAYISIGVVIAWFMHLIPIKIYKLAAVPLLMVSWILLIVALTKGESVNNASRWISIFGKTIQPSEFAKLGLTMTAAFVLSIFRDEKGASKFGFKVLVGFISITLLLIVFENLSTAAIIFIVLFGISFFAQAPTKYLAWIGGAVIGCAILGITLCHSIPESTLDRWASNENKDKLTHRIPTWVHRIIDKHELPEKAEDYNITENIQVTHAHIAIGTCGFIGKGPGNSIERDFLPQAYSDFIYAIVIEEGGFLAGFGVMFLYMLLLWRAMRIASRCKTLFPSYLIMGLALMMVTQAMVNMAVAVGAMPVTGQPLPLISRGGTSTFVNCAYLGIMLAVSRNARMESNGLPVAEIEYQEENKETTDNNIA